jgi:hypothetical protein
MGNWSYGENSKFQIPNSKLQIPISQGADVVMVAQGCLGGVRGGLEMY